jgi:hypothetical protein
MCFEVFYFINIKNLKEFYGNKEYRNYRSRGPWQDHFD